MKRVMRHSPDSCPRGLAAPTTQRAVAEHGCSDHQIGRPPRRG